MLLISEALHQGSGQTSIIPPTLPTNSGAAASGTVKKQGVRSREFQPEEWVAIGLARECIAATYEHAALQAQARSHRQNPTSVIDPNFKAHCSIWVPAAFEFMVVTCRTIAPDSISLLKCGMYHAMWTQSPLAMQPGIPLIRYSSGKL